MTPARSSTAADTLFISVVVMLSTIPYVGGLGFYSDDWSFLSYLSMSPDQSVVALTGRMFDVDIMQARPVHSLYIALLYAGFGLQPLGYHIVNSLVLAVAAAVLYLVVRRLGAGRAPALAVALIWAMAPHYSSDRFWFAAFQIPLSALAYFLHVYATLRAVTPGDGRAWLWLVGSFFLAGLCLLAYEVFLPLLLLSPVGAWYWAGRQGARGHPAGAMPWLLVPLIVAIAWFKGRVTKRIADASASEHLAWFREFFADAVASVTSGDFGLGLPRLLATALVQYPDPVARVVAGVIGIGVFVYLVRVMGGKDESAGGWTAAIWLLVAGIVFFVGGYAIFLVTFNAAVVTTGTNNRIAIAAAVGVALVVVGVVGLVGRWRGGGLRSWLVAATVASLCAAGSLLNATIGSFWVAAADRQGEVLSLMAANADRWPADAVVLLDGFCPYVGPAPVFEGEWDASGALQLVARDRSRRADVVTPKLRIRPEGVYTSMYGYVYGPYRYGALIVADIARDRSLVLGTPLGGLKYFRESSPGRTGACPPATEGVGRKILSAGEPPVDLGAGSAWRSGRISRYPVLDSR